MVINTLAYIEAYEKIKAKDGSVIPFVLNEGQRKLYDAIKMCHEEGRLPRIIVLKARQIGFSTLAAGIISEKINTKHNRMGGVMAHRDDSTKSLMEKYKLIHRELPEGLRPTVSKDNDHEFLFDNKEHTGLNSGIKVYTAGGAGIGRGDTFHYWHISEYAFWLNNKAEILLGILQTVPKEQDTLVIIESTANGFDDFRRRWYQAVNGESDYVPVFVGWNEMREYRSPFNGDPLTDEEVALKQKYNLDDEQIQWRRDTIRNECGGDIRMFHQEYPITPEEAFVTTGHCYFETNAVISRIQKIEKNKKNIERGNFVFDIDSDGRVRDQSIRWEKSPDGFTKIFTAPEENRPYVIGGDTAGEGSDRSVGMVLDNTNGNQVAVFCGNVDEDYYSYQMYCLGRYYNNALMCIESNFNTYQNKILSERLNYPNMFLREIEDSITHQFRKSYGFRTDVRTRPLILAELRRIVRDEPEKIADSETLLEMLTFVVNERGRPEAMAGEHDDRVMALAIAHYSRGQQSFYGKMDSKPARKKLIQSRRMRRIL